MSDNGRIRVFTTGGTFDKEYNELTGELFFQRTHLPDMLRLGRCHLDVAVESLMMVDSLEMSDQRPGVDRRGAARRPKKTAS